MNIRLSVIVQQQAELFARWTENYFLFATDFTSALPSVSTLADNLDVLHGNQTVPVKYRMADIDNFRNVKQDKLNYAPKAATGIVSDSDYFNTACLVKATGASGKIVRYWIRSIWDGAVDQGGVLQRGGFWYKNFVAYRNFLVGSPFRLRIRASNPKVPITQIDLTTGIVTAPAHPFAVGNLVHLYRVRGVRYLQKTWQISATTTNTFTLGFYNPALAIGTAELSTPYASLVSYNYDSIAEVEAVRATAHETARPLDRLPGRRKIRR